MKIGVFGGTFDPPHKTHLAIARTAKEFLSLDEVIFVPANQNPLKSRRIVTPAKQRLEMVKLATAGDQEFAVSDIEITRGGPSYAVETISELQFARPGDYWLILGSDSAKTLKDWHQPEKLLKLCRLAVILRPGTDADEMKRHLPPGAADRIDIIPLKESSMSSTEIRTAIALGHNVSRWLPDGVQRYIINHKLYQQPI